MYMYMNLSHKRALPVPSLKTCSQYNLDSVSTGCNSLLQYVSDGKSRRQGQRTGPHSDRKIMTACTRLCSSVERNTIGGTFYNVNVQDGCKESYIQYSSWINVLISVLVTLKLAQLHRMKRQQLLVLRLLWTSCLCTYGSLVDSNTPQAVRVHHRR